VVLVYKAGETKYDINKIQIIVPEEKPFFPAAPSKGGARTGAQEQDAAERALERAFGGGASAPAPKGEPNAPAPTESPPASDELPPSAEQDEAAKALERAMQGSPAPPGSSK
jgi:hypothetical protein